VGLRISDVILFPNAEAFETFGFITFSRILMRLWQLCFTGNSLFGYDFIKVF
jgi:hypothetical protein